MKEDDASKASKIEIPSPYDTPEPRIEVTQSSIRQINPLGISHPSTAHTDNTKGNPPEKDDLIKPARAGATARSKIGASVVRTEHRSETWGDRESCGKAKIHRLSFENLFKDPKQQSVEEQWSMTLKT